MGTTELTLPDLGEGVEEGTVIAVLVAAGDVLAAEQAVVEIETDKVTLEVPAPRAGTVREICVTVDQKVRPGDVVLRIDESGGNAAEAVTAAPASGAGHEAAGAVPDRVAVATPSAPAAAPAGIAAGPSTTVVPAGPAARREARELGVDIAAVPGHGRRGRITRDDVRHYVRQRAPRVDALSRGAPPLPDLAAFGPVRREAADRVTRAMADNMTRSAACVAQAWVGRDVDITALEAARRRLRARQQPDAPPLTLTAIVCKAVAIALAELPKFNAALDDGVVVYREYVNLGVAVDTPRGLLVPVIRGADTLSVVALAAELARLSGAAREGSLAPGDLRGAGFTVSNLGGLGVNAMQPLVNWPEVAILGISAARSAGDGLLLPLTLGFDHRLIDGADAARFLARLAALLGEVLELAVAA